MGQYVKMRSDDVRRLLGSEGFDSHVFEGRPLDGGDRNVYFVDEEWYEKTMVNYNTD